MFWTVWLTPGSKTSKDNVLLEGTNTNAVGTPSSFLFLRSLLRNFCGVSDSNGRLVASY
jgi:hypothetical protein